MRNLVPLIIAVLVIATTAQLDCSQVPKAVNNSGLMSCNCLQRYFWNGLSCQVNYSEVSTSTGISLVALEICACQYGYVWNTQSTDYIPTNIIINCSAINNS